MVRKYRYGGWVVWRRDLDRVTANGRHHQDGGPAADEDIAVGTPASAKTDVDISDLDNDSRLGVDSLYLALGKEADLSAVRRPERKEGTVCILEDSN